MKTIKIENHSTTTAFTIIVCLLVLHTRKRRKKHHRVCHMWRGVCHATIGIGKPQRQPRENADSISDSAHNHFVLGSRIHLAEAALVSRCRVRFCDSRVGGCVFCWCLAMFVFAPILTTTIYDIAYELVTTLATRPGDQSVWPLWRKVCAWSIARQVWCRTDREWERWQISRLFRLCESIIRLRVCAYLDNRVFFRVYPR